MSHYFLQFFSYAHLPSHLAEVSRPFGELAEQLYKALPDNPERAEAFRKLLEAKDCAVRSVITKGYNECKKTELAKYLSS